MSRDLKNEYVAMLDQEIPDLWSRIEPKLTEKTGKSRMSQTAGMQEAGTQTTDAQINQTQITQMQEAGTQITGGQTVRRKKSARRRSKRSTIAVLGSLAAACVCLALILPAWRGSEKGSDRSNQMAADNTVTDYVSADEAAKGESAENGGMLFEMEPESSSAEAGSADEDVMNFDASSDGTLSVQESISDDSEEASDYESSIAQSPQENDKETIEAPAEEETDQIEDASEPEPAYECRGEIIDAWRTQEGFFYRMELAENVEGFMPAGSEIVIFQKAGLFPELGDIKNAALTTGYSYRVIVETEGTTSADGEIRYALMSYEKDEDGSNR